MPSSDSVNIGVIVERRPIDHPWQDHEWRVVAVVPDPPAGLDPGSVAVGEWLYVAGIVALRLHTTDVEAYVENLTSPEVALYVVLRGVTAAGNEMPYVLDRVTANPYEAQYYIDDEEILVDKVAMPEAMIEWLEAYVAEHYREEPFRKRKRDSARIEAYTFGHEPIVELRKRLKATNGDEIP